MQLKDSSVNLDGVDGAIFYAMSLIEPIMKKYGPFVCTSAKDGSHMKGSLHDVGLAFDIRIRHIDPVKQIELIPILKEVLGPDYDFIIEKDHYHVEVSDKWLAENGDPRVI